MATAGVGGFQPNREELAWAAGFFDGEGSTWLTRCHTPNLGITISQTRSPELLHRFNVATNNLGTVRGPFKPRKRNHTEFWKYDVYGLEKVQAIIVMLSSFLGKRKVDQYANVLAIALDHARKEVWRGSWNGQRKDSKGRFLCKEKQVLV